MVGQRKAITRVRSSHRIFGASIQQLPIDFGVVSLRQAEEALDGRIYVAASLPLDFGVSSPSRFVESIEL